MNVGIPLAIYDFDEISHILVRLLLAQKRFAFL